VPPLFLDYANQTLQTLLFRPMTNHVSVQNDTIWFLTCPNDEQVTVLILMMIKQSSAKMAIDNRVSYLER